MVPFAGQVVVKTPKTGQIVLSSIGGVKNFLATAPNRFKTIANPTAGYRLSILYESSRSPGQQASPQVAGVVFSGQEPALSLPKRRPRQNSNAGAHKYSGF